MSTDIKQKSSDSKSIPDDFLDVLRKSFSPSYGHWNPQPSLRGPVIFTRLLTTPQGSSEQDQCTQPVSPKSPHQR